MKSARKTFGALLTSVLSWTAKTTTIVAFLALGRSSDVQAEKSQTTQPKGKDSYSVTDTQDSTVQEEDQSQDWNYDSWLIDVSYVQVADASAGWDDENPPRAE